MREPILIALALLLVGCGARQDGSICMAIVDPLTPQSAEDSLALQSDTDWQRARAEACVHRQAYRLAHSSDPAQTVATAVMEACDVPVAAAVALIRSKIYTATEGNRSEDRQASAQVYADDALKSYERLALLKVVEGRAGNCRA